jgi:peptide/nickel transport system permease protein
VSAVPGASPPRSLFMPRRAATRLTARPGIGALAGVVVAVLLFLAITGSLCAPDSPQAINLLHPFAGSSSAHLLGTDDQGRDILSRLIAGTRTALLAPLVLVGATTVIGTALAIASAWFGGVVNSLIARLLDFMLAFPSILLALVVIALFGQGLSAAIIGLSFAYAASTARVVRSAAIRERSQPYIAALVVQGLPGRIVCVRHLLRNVLRLVATQATASFGYAMLDLAALSYLGFGVQPPTTDWGLMVSEGQASIVLRHPAESLYAGLAIVVAVVAFNVASDRLALRLGTVSR